MRIFTPFNKSSWSGKYFKEKLTFKLCICKQRRHAVRQKQLHKNKTK